MCLFNLFQFLYFKMWSDSCTGHWAVVQLPCGSILQNLLTSCWNVILCPTELSCPWWGPLMKALFENFWFSTNWADSALILFWWSAVFLRAITAPVSPYSYLTLLYKCIRQVRKYKIKVFPGLLLGHHSSGLFVQNCGPYKRANLFSQSGKVHTPIVHNQ